MILPFCCVRWAETCPKCKGRGFPDIEDSICYEPFGNWHKRCKKCDGRGYVTKTEWRFAELLNC